MLGSIATTIAAGLAAAGPAAAQPAGTLTITGAGFGHGVGMSQYGALGFAEHGWTYDAILRHYFTGTSLGQAPAGRVVRVLLQGPKVASFTGATRAGSTALQANKTYKVAPAAGGRVALTDASGKRLALYGAPLVVTGPGPLTLNGTAANGVTNGQYRGWLEFRPGSSGNVLAVNAIGLEQYVAGVVSAESPSSWPLAALEAQAVAARTYAMTTDAGGSVFDQYADTRSQMYKGVAAEYPSTNQAVNGTRGDIVTYHGRPVATFFFSTSGGRTENNEDSFLGGTPMPWLRSVDDPYDNVSPVHVWQPQTLSFGQAAAKLGGLVKGSFQGITVDQRGVSPRIMYAEVVGTGGTTRVTGATLRARLGLRDTWAFFTAITTQIVPAGAQPVPSGGGAQSAARGRSALAGRVLPGGARTLVRVQRRAGARWVAAGSTRTRARGAYRVALAAPGTYRVVVRGAAGPAVRAR